uniref:Uncharacterized protein n=1 Tax=Strombidium inclinatum TaxID=197538 RepID=A0A7S3IV36_9SPIT|mmetsp:Transcript_42293/g.64848  ORF Transcript_42293/g.64848 Transcript_42293/m.64848 type:complete len:172 (+) Transcript_42293:2244-2759(+)
MKDYRSNDKQKLYNVLVHPVLGGPPLPVKRLNKANLVEWNRLGSNELLIHSLKSHDHIDDLIEQKMRKEYAHSLVARALSYCKGGEPEGEIRREVDLLVERSDFHQLAKILNSKKKTAVATDPEAEGADAKSQSSTASDDLNSLLGKRTREEEEADDVLRSAFGLSKRTKC